MSLFKKMAAPLAALTVATLLFGAFVTSANAQVPPFTAYGSGQTAGDTVEAWNGTVSCGSATVDADGNWLLQIGSDAPCAPAEGDAITFTLNGAATDASETYKAGGAPADVAAGITLTATGDVMAPAPADTGNAGFLTENSTGLAAMLALGAFALLAVGGARAATRRR
jgi:hypothetical protein